MATAIALSPMVIALLLLVGWCGTVPRPRFPPVPLPDPVPDYWVSRTAGAIGGLLGGWLVASSGVDMAGTGLLTAVFAALLVGRALGDIAGKVMGGMGR